MRDAERIANDARQPFVEHALELRLLRLDEGFRHAAGHEFRPPARREIAGEVGVPIVLEILDLIRRPAIGHADQALGDVAFREMRQREHLAL